MALDEKRQRSEMNADWVLGNLKVIVVRCMREETYDAPGAVRALELIARLLGMITDRHSIDLRVEERIERVERRIVQPNPRGELQALRVDEPLPGSRRGEIEIDEKPPTNGHAGE